MPGEALLIGIATIAVAVAGFTAVTSTLTPPGGSWSPGMRVRQRGIVSTSFNVVFEALAPLIVFAWLDDVHSAFVIASAGVAVYTSGDRGLRARQFLRAGSTRTPSTMLLMALGPTAVLAVRAERACVRISRRLHPGTERSAIRRRHQLLFPGVRRAELRGRILSYRTRGRAGFAGNPRRCRSWPRCRRTWSCGHGRPCR